MTGSELERFDPDRFAVLKYDDNDLREIVQANIGGEGVGEYDLDKVKVPSGGGTSWAVPTLQGEQDVKELEGIVLHWANRRAYWEDSFSGGNEPPQCSSPDGINGYGDPGDKLRALGKGCLECPNAAFGSADDGVGQACKAMRVLFLLTPNSLLPLVVTLPPASLGNAKKYFLRLVSSGVPHTAITTKLTLAKDKSASGITYSRVEFTAGDPLPPEAAARIKAYADQLAPGLVKAAASIDRSEAEGSTDE